MKKICPGCGQERDAESDFSWKNKTKGTRQRWCKSCQAEANKTHYQNNKQVYLDRAITRNDRVNTANRHKLYAYFSSHPCVDCGETDIRVLEFDHVLGNKSANIARLLNNAISWKAIEDEVAKCEVRCVNCHRIKTGERGGWWRFGRSGDTTSSLDHQPGLSGEFEEAHEPFYTDCSIRTNIGLKKKFCSSCGEERDAEKDFSWRDRGHGIRQPRCKYCQSEMSKLHYQNNKRTYNERTRISKARALAENRMHISSYLSTHPCVDCGQTDIRLLEFDHINGQKSRGIANFLTWGFKWSTIEAEIAKCEVRCANCHRIKTIEWDRGWRSTQPTKQPAKSYQMMRIYLSTHPCIDCGNSDIRVLEFDHIHGHKTDEISHLLSQGYAWPIIEAEIAKCEVRCANCHRLKTMERGKWWRFGSS